MNMKLINVISSSPDLQSLERITSSADAILLRQDAVYLASRSDVVWPACRLYVLSSDLIVRKLTASSAFTVISDTEWVELTCQAQQSMLW